MENHDLKFTGKFTDLKDKGYTFMKLYANNYKVYNKKLPGGWDFWVWVGDGGSIEIEDYYSNTKNFIDGIKSINWNEIENRKSFSTGKMRKTTFIRFSHANPDRGFKTTKISFDREMKPNDNNWGESYDEEFDRVREYHDREVRIYQDTAIEILKEIEKINN